MNANQNNQLPHLLFLLSRELLGHTTKKPKGNVGVDIWHQLGHHRLLSQPLPRRLAGESQCIQLGLGRQSEIAIVFI